MSRVDLYKNYTSTSMLLGYDEKGLTTWSEKYFEYHLLKHFPDSRGSRILEIGCGYGRHLRSLLKNGYVNIWGIDISEEQIAYAQDKLGIKNVKVADALTFLEKERNKYDAIIMLDVLEHMDVEYSIRLIRQIWSTLSDNGVLIIQVPNALSPLSVNRDWDITHQRAYTTHSMEQSLRMGGFESIQHFPLPPFANGVKSFIRCILWNYIINPVITMYLRVAVGGRMGGIYTENLLSVATKC